MDSTRPVSATDGPAALSLRQVAAQAGVSHTAPHHFGDKQHLLTALAIDGFTSLADTMTRALDSVDQPADRLPALLSAYVAHHREHPGYAAIMWRTDLLDTADPRLQHASLQTFQLLHDQSQAGWTGTGRADLAKRHGVGWSGMGRDGGDRLLDPNRESRARILPGASPPGRYSPAQPGCVQMRRHRVKRRRGYPT